MDRAQKQEAIETLKGVFDGAGAVVVTHYMGLTVAEMTDLRGRLRVEGAQLQVVKNTLVQKALAGSVGEAGDALFKGPVAIAFAPDPVSAAKVATQYAKDHEKFSVVGGLMFRAPGGWSLVEVGATLTRTFAGRSVPIPTATEQLRLLRLFGRPKDLAKAERLARWLQGG